MPPLRPKPFRNPGLAALGVLAMAIGIGSFSASVVFARALLPNLPVEEPDRVVELARTVPRWPDRHLPLQGSDLRAIQQHVGGLEVVGGLRIFPAHLTGDDGPPVRVRAAQVSPGVLQALGVGPLLGRWLETDDRAGGEAGAVVLSHALWQSRFGGDPAVLGRRIEVNDRSAAVVGVMPSGFAFPQREDLWLPLGLRSVADVEDGGPWLVGIGRLRDGATIERVRAELTGLTVGRLDAGVPDGAGATFTVRRWVDMLRAGDATAEAVPAGVTLFVLVLVVACANVALLFLVRALRAERTTAMRMALGAARSTVVLERLVETLTLALVGGVLGLGLSLAWATAMRRLGVGLFDYGVEFGVDWTVGVLTALGVVVAALLAGLVPALRGTDLDLARVLREGSQGGSVRVGRAARLLLLAEVAFSCVILVGVGHSFRGARSVLRSSLSDLPVPAEELLVGRYELLDERHPHPVARTELHRRVIETLAADLRVEAVAVADALPGVVPGFGARSRALEIEGMGPPGEGGATTSRVVTASPGFFTLLGVDVVRGRGLTWDDRPERERVAVVNESFARRYLAGGEVLGARIAFAPDEWRSVVGVVRDVATRRPDGSADAVYVPVSELGRTPWVMVRTRDDPRALAPAVRDAVWEEDPRIPVYDLSTMESTILEAAGPARLLVTTLALLAVAALVITAVGLHGLMAFSLGRRTREIAVRSALGAPAGSIAWQVFRGVGGWLAVGLAAGTGIAWWLSPFLGEALLGSDPHDPTLYVAVPCLVLAAAAAAGLAPVVRALRLEVMEALRVE